MWRSWLLAVAAIALATPAGCAVQPVQPVSPLAPVETPSSGETAATPAENVAVQVQNAIAEQTQLSPDQVTVVSVEEVEWPDACLGVYKPEEMCAAVITPGFRVIVETPAGNYEVHTDAGGRSLRIASAPGAER